MWVLMLEMRVLTRGCGLLVAVHVGCAAAGVAVAEGVITWGRGAGWRRLRRCCMVRQVWRLVDPLC